MRSKNKSENMKPEYHEDYDASDDIEPLSMQSGVEHFDHSQIGLCECSACQESKAISDEQTKERDNRLTVVNRKVADFITRIPTNARNPDKFIAQRFIAAMWVLDPNYFGGESLNTITSRTGMTKMMLSRITAEFSKEFGIFNLAQAHGIKN